MSKELNFQYPSIYMQARTNSSVYQKANHALLIANLIILVAAAGIEAFKIEWLSNLYPKTVLLSASILLAIITKKLSLEEKWYAARSLSETVKTLIWRYRMGAAPFNSSGVEQGLLLLERLEAACLESNSLIGSNKFHLNKNDPLLAEIKHAEDLSTDNITTYIENRLTPQLKWYSTKAKRNSTMSRVFFATFITCNFFAVLCSAWQETDTSFTLPITGLLIAISTALIGWIESKKYSELAAAYSLTHGEIELLHSDIHDISSRENFSAFVNDAESLFSREHTQWAAKRRYIRKI
ncbi:DUF4231 domain-containing protein [Pseudomonas sp. 14P_8.1_Bac3]|uniref:DUF4231 domain-containing protein n=1 Tax=Pseudomonas sp. 14P_8.1_Bac3 TaxID=2971621 RepID=UPI0021C7A7B8|nr:DUF4231 domain-containing protein [Pseudomonas sp. 14P_8.1_Bac3]MCU1760403.1 DUF4231 domain-containing protein [Pseudomonas sp. 14P_8.1_Bac3]